jgi:3-oxoacyl-[acyl-carrier protein] reductase
VGSLAGKTALVTGGSRGIGRAIVQRLANDGASVVFSFVKDRCAAEEVVAGVRRAGGQVFAVKADQGKRDDLQCLFAEADRLLGGLDILVLNAAEVKRAKIIDVAEDDYDRIMAVNAKGSFLAIQFAGQKLRDDGRIINISTVGTGRSSPTWAVYNASKAAIEQFIRTAALEFGGRGIMANSVSPGATDTDGLREMQSPRGLDHLINSAALRRLGRPSDIANVVAFLAGPESQWITGQTISATGGLT